MMNIWILNHYAITPDMPGGSRHYDLGKELVKRGYEVTIFASSFNYFTRRDEKLREDETFREEEVGGVKFIWIRTFPYLKNDWRRVVNWLSYTVRVINIGGMMKEEAELIIGSSVHLFAPLAAYVLSCIKKSRFIFEVRDLWPQTLIDIGSISKNHPLIIFFRFLERFLYKRADKIISLLPKIDNYITKLGIPKEKIVWIPNGVDMSCFDDHSISKKKDSGKFIIMYLGAHGKANALDVILDAAKIIHDRGIDSVRFSFIGDGPEKENLIRQSKHLNLDNIEFKEAIPKHLVPEIMSGADAFIFCLKASQVFKYGVSSNKLFDYMQAERPVIFSCNSHNNPINEANAGLTVPPQNAEALAEAVARLYSLSTEEKLQMGKRGKQYVKENHNISELAERLIKVADELQKTHL
jgi:glycosyltransferase involved in cell wall biosynthesis